jgi:hypothetical protein
MRVPRTSTGTSTTTPASSGPVRVRKPSALARICSADGQVQRRLTVAQALERRFHARNVIIEVIVKQGVNVGAGEAGTWEANWERLVTFAR